MRLRLPWLGAIAFSFCACSEPAPKPSYKPLTVDRTCRFDQTWNFGELRAENGLKFVELTEVPVKGKLWKPGSDLRFDVEVAHEGWSLFGHGRPAEDDLFRLKKSLWATDYLVFVRGLVPRVVEVGDGRARLTLQKDAFDEAVSFGEEPKPWVGCGSFGIDVEPPGFSEAKADAHRALKLPERTGTLWVEAGQRVAVRNAVDGPVVAHIHSQSWDLPLSVIEASETHVRVTFDRAGFAMLVGWVEKSAVVEKDGLGAGGGGTGFGTVGGHSKRCRADVPLDIEIRYEGVNERVGTIEPGTVFVARRRYGERIEVRPDIAGIRPLVPWYVQRPASCAY